MTSEHYSRFALFALIGAAIWLGFMPFYQWLFSWTEHVPGVNWVYLPHGVRMILVMLFGAAGALGFTIGAVIYTQFTGYGPTFDPSLDLALAVIPGLAAWVAVMLTFFQWPGRSLQPMVGSSTQAMEGRRLLLLAFVSAILNSTSNITVRYALGNGAHDWVDLWTAMLIGDLFGALLLLYTLKGCILIFDNLTSTAMHHERKAKP